MNELNQNVDQIHMVENNNIVRYYHRSTSNKSFVEMSNYLQAIGVKNNRFMLTLLDPDLANIDPHDPNLPFHIKNKVLCEVYNNFWYYLREVVRIPNPGEPSRFILNRGNMAFLYLATMNFNCLLMQPRQTGKTIAAAAFYTYVYNFRAQNTQISLLNKEFKDSKENLARIRAIRDLLPPYLRFDAVFSVVNGKKKKVPNTAIAMEHAVNHNKLRTYAKARNELLAANLLRGQTFPLLWADEFGFIPFMKTIYGNMIPAMRKATEIARRNNAPYGILYTTTPGFLTTEEGKYAYNVMNCASKFNEAWYDLQYTQIQEIVDANKLSNFIHIQFSYQELGYSEEWFYKACKEAEWDWPLIRREYLLEWSDEAENCPFTKDELDIVKKFCKEPKKTILIFNKYELKIFEEIPLKSNLVPKYPPIMGVDPSGGVSKDSSCITIIDSKTTRVFAELRSNTASLIDLARVIEYIILNMMPNAIVNIERNGGYGLSVIGKLKETKVKRNLYYEVKEKVVEETIEGNKLVRSKKITKVYGLQSTNEVRNELIELLKERMNLHKDKFISPTIYNELRGLEVKKNGKVEHSALGHDDQIFSYLMAIYVWYDGKNLRENFNIEKSSIRTEADIDDILELESANKQSDSMTKYIAEVNQSSTSLQNDINKQLNDIKRSQGEMFNEFIMRQRAQEQEHLKQLLYQKNIREAYARKYQIPLDAISLEDGTDFADSNQSLPNSIFLDFNKDIEEMEPYSVYNHLNNYDGLIHQDQNNHFSNYDDNGLQ